MSPIRPSKQVAMALVRRMAPEYLEFFRDMQKPEGWRVLAQRFTEVRKRLKLDSYVVLYGSDTWLLNALALALFGQEGARELSEEMEKASPEDQRALIDQFTNEAISDERWLEEVFPESPERQAAQTAAFQGLNDEEKAEVAKRGQHLLAFTFGWFYSCISVMVHGEKLTSLVPKAIAGDKEAFLKAIHVDKSLLHAHPAFVERYERAKDEQDQDFLGDVGYHVQAPATKGRVDYPGAYIVFALLESLGWLNDLRHEEILDVCDEAGLDRWENRIEDVNYLTKRLGAYRKMQRRGGLSMR